jgi:hypothetical protein
MVARFRPRRRSLSNRNVNPARFVTSVKRMAAWGEDEEEEEDEEGISSNG